jgi:hypothetical protein
MILLLAIDMALPAWGKKHPTTTTAPTTQETPKSAKGKEAEVETHKHRAAEFADGKDLDKEKTKGKVDRLNDQVADLDKKLKDSGQAPTAETPSKHKHHPATQPTTQEAPKEGKSKSKKG